MPKNAPSLRPTAAAALLSAALFCVIVELAFARETQYFYNSVTGEVLLRGVRFATSSSLFSNLDPVSLFCDRMIARLESFLSGSLSSVVVVSPRRTTTKRDTKTTTREEVFSDFLCATSQFKHYSILYILLGDLDGPENRALDRRGDREEVLANGRRDGDVGIARGLERRVVRGTQNAVLREQKNVGKHVGSPGRISMGKSEPRS